MAAPDEDTMMLWMSAIHDSLEGGELSDKGTI
jgi:hypothetical protein